MCYNRSIMNNEINNEKETKEEQIISEHDCHQSPEDGCQACADRADVEQWKDTKDTCEHCEGTGEVTRDVFDTDSGQYQPTGTRKCVCTLKEDSECLETDAY